MKILIAEDDAINRLLLATVLRKIGYDPVEAVDGSHAWEELCKPDAPSLVIMDWMMPGMDGLEVVQRVRALPTDRPPYIIMLTANSGKQNMIAGLDAGANDYLTKPFDAEILRARLDVGRRMVELQDELSHSRQALAYLATHDPLTELPNRRTILERFGKELAHAQRHGDCLSVGMLDIDHFKVVNDTYGHQVGDDLLRGLAKCLMGTCREYDVVGRIGGEEFLVIAPMKAGSPAAPFFDRIRATVACTGIPTRAGPKTVTLSIGVATAMESDTPENLLGLADSALYHAKESGRDRVSLMERNNQPAN
jgi:diguanylate cyclase (GGDEF)-like protein